MENQAGLIMLKSYLLIQAVLLVVCIVDYFLIKHKIWPFN